MQRERQSERERERERGGEKSAGVCNLPVIRCAYSRVGCVCQQNRLPPSPELSLIAGSKVPKPDREPGSEHAEEARVCVCGWDLC